VVYNSGSIFLVEIRPSGKHIVHNLPKTFRFEWRKGSENFYR
jgi:hypothetical protein